MTRRFGTQIALVPGDGRGAWLRARLDLTGIAGIDPSAHAAETARSVPHATLAGAIGVFAALGGEAGHWRPFADGGWVVQPLPAAAVAEPWRAAVIANLADFATHPSDDDIRLFDRIEIAAPALPGLPIETALLALEQRMEAARMAMTARLPTGFHLDEYAGSAWPRDADAYVFDIEMALACPLGAAEQTALMAHLEALETMVAWMGFATEGSARSWVDRGAMVFGGEVRAGATALGVVAERPPSDIALMLDLIDALVTRAENAIDGWTIAIRPGD